MTNPHMADPRRGFSRRAFLGGTAATSMMAIAARLDTKTGTFIPGDLQLDAAEIPFAVSGLQPSSPVLTLSVERDTDMVLTDFTFYGFTVDKNSDPPSIVATAETNSDLWIGVVVQFPPQAIGEAEYFSPSNYKPSNPADKGAVLDYDPTPVLSKVSGPSRLAFTFASGDSIPLPTMKVADLLDWQGWTLNVTQTALTGTGIAYATEPTDIQCAIECPLSMYLSPVVDGESSKIVLEGFDTYFTNRTEPFTSSQHVTECWTTSLGGFSREIILDDIVPFVPSVAAVWADDYASGSANATPEQYILYFPYEAPPQ